MNHLNRTDIYNRLQSTQSCSPAGMFLYQVGVWSFVAALLSLSTHWMLTVYALSILLLAMASYKVLDTLRQPLNATTGDATELATLLVDRLVVVKTPFWFLCAAAIASSGMGVVMACLYDATFLMAALPLFMAQPFFSRLRCWSGIARRVCIARKMETFDRFHVSRQAV